VNLEISGSFLAQSEMVAALAARPQGDSGEQRGRTMHADDLDIIGDAYPLIMAADTGRVSVANWLTNRPRSLPV
jgi:hypothetical protein